MATPTHVTVSYSRKVTPAQYESEEVKLEGSFAVGEDEDFEAVAYDMMARARVQAHRVLGRSEPAIAPFEPAFGEEIDISKFRSSDSDEPAKVDGSPKAKRKRRTKAEMEAARAAEAGENALGAQAPADDIDVMDEPEKNPAAEEVDLDTKQSFNDVVEIADIQAAATKIAKRLGGPKEVQAVMKEYGVLRIGDLKPEQRAPFLTAIEAL